MRTKIGLTLVALLVIGIVGTAVSRPMMGRRRGTRTPGPGQRMGWMSVTPPLTAEQAEKIGDLRIGHQKDTMDLRADLQEKQLELHTLMTTAEPDQRKINTVVEEMESLRTRLHKQGVSYRLKVWAILTPEQRIALKAHGPGFGGRHGWGYSHRGHGPNWATGLCWN